MHIADVANGNLGANGIVAGSMTIAVGAALSQKLLGTEQVVLCFFGDGAANEGSFHEAVNLAAVWQLPVLFLCENNQYGMSMASDLSTAGGSVADRGAAYGHEGKRIDGNDVAAVFAAVRDAAATARGGGGPALLEAVTYRDRGHSKSDRNLYRTQDEIEEWRTERDPLIRFEGQVREAGLLDDTAVAAAKDAAKARIRDAVGQAVTSPNPDVAVLEGSAYAS